MSQQPYIRFFGTDWRSDPSLRMCSAAARGVWIDCITLMMEATPYGSLVINGRAVTAQQLAVLTCTPLDVVTAALVELEENGVLSRDADGIAFSRRLVRDRDRAEQDKLNGGKGGNPRISRKAAERPVDNFPDDGGANCQGVSHSDDSGLTQSDNRGLTVGLTPPLTPGLTPTLNPHGNTIPNANTIPNTKTRGGGGGRTGVRDGPPAPRGAEQGASPGTRFDPGWIELPDGWRDDPDVAGTGGTAAEIDREFRKFRDYWLAASGDKALKSNWLAAWRIWVRRAAAEGDIGKGASPPVAASGPPPATVVVLTAPDVLTKLRGAGIADGDLQRWFREVEWQPDARTLVVQSPFTRQRIETEFSVQLAKAFGPGVQVVAIQSRRVA
jgi:hypothetical protein